MARSIRAQTRKGGGVDIDEDVVLAVVAMVASPSSTDVPRAWLTELLRARVCLDEADSLEDGSQRLCQLIDVAQDIEEALVQAFLEAAA